MSDEVKSAPEAVVSPSPASTPAPAPVNPAIPVELPKFNSVEEINTYFSDLLGANAVLPSPETNRPYLKVATKGEATLYLNVSLSPMCHHPNGEKDHLPALGVMVRFMQKGGGADSFTPPLKVRAVGADMIRLSKHAFPICKVVKGLHPMQVRASWISQNVSEQIVGWVLGSINFCGATPVSKDKLRQVVDLGAPRAGDMGPVEGVFSINVPHEESDLQALHEKVKMVGVSASEDVGGGLPFPVLGKNTYEN